MTFVPDTRNNPHSSRCTLISVSFKKALVCDPLVSGQQRFEEPGSSSVIVARVHVRILEPWRLLIPHGNLYLNLNLIKWFGLMAHFEKAWAGGQCLACSAETDHSRRPCLRPVKPGEAVSGSPSPHCHLVSSAPNTSSHTFLWAKF